MKQDKTILDKIRQLYFNHCYFTLFPSIVIFKYIYLNANFDLLNSCLNCYKLNK